MSFGPAMRCEFDGFGITLNPPKKEDLPLFSEGLSSVRVNMYTGTLFAQSIENEQEWYEKRRKDDDNVHWTITPDGSDEIVGITGLHGIQNVHGGCSSGIIIFNTDWWGKGVASRSHLARTMFAANFLNRNTITSMVRRDNKASRKALERVGYGVTGCSPCTAFRGGEFLDTLHLTWINPTKLSMLFPKGLPKNYRKSVENARIALEKASEVVQFE